MPRIRKKTSKRISTHQRAKFKHKVAEGRKKKKKEAKKNPQWKSKKKKDPGIPSEFPYKDQILAEIAETRRQAEEAKQRRKEEKKAAREGDLVPADLVPADGDDSPDDSVAMSWGDDAPLLLNPDLPNLKAVLERADVVLHVLDARDPASYRLPEIEALTSADGKPKTVFILNKIDLVPRETLLAWAKYLRSLRCAFLFRAASAFLPQVPSKNQGRPQDAVNDALGSEALLEYLDRRAREVQNGSLQVALVGLANSGKSAIINSLARTASVPIYKPGTTINAWNTTTTRAFEISVARAKHTIHLIDTPGVSFQTEQENQNASFKVRDMLLRQRGRVDKVKDPIPAAEHIVSRARAQDLMVHYNLPAFAAGDGAAFLAGVARVMGMQNRGGAPDLTGAARVVLRDWMTGRLPFYTDAPASAAGPAAQVEDGDEEVAAGTETEEDLAALYARADAAALAAVRTRRDMRLQGGGLVKVARGELERRRMAVDAPFVVEGDGGEAVVDGERGDLDGEDGDEEEDEDEEGDDDGDEGDDEDEDEDEEEDIPISPAAHKRKRKEAASTVSRPTKKVAFAIGTQDHHKRKKHPEARPSLKTGNKKLAGDDAKTDARKSQGHDDEAYDFDQFFKS